MPALTKNDNVREFMGLPVNGEIGRVHSRREYTPRPIEELYPYIKEAFDKGIKAITWHQYTPYFNDGEPCEFNVYDVSVTGSDEVAENWLEGDFYEDRLVEVSEQEYREELEATKHSRYSYFPYEERDGKFFRRYEEGTYDYIPSGTHPDGIKSDLNTHINDLEFEDALRAKFGDGTQVVLSPAKVVQFEYEHE